MEEGDRSAARVFAVLIAERRERAAELQLDDPETLLALCRKIRDVIDSDPARALEEADFLFGFLSTPKRAIGLFDEREYFLGEAALLAGTASRILARRDDAVRWFDRAEGNFRLTVNAVADWSRVSYQRLALLLEERRFDELLEQLPALVDSFERLDMAEDALKCRFVEGLAKVETGDLSAAAETFEQLRQKAEAAHNDNLLASALANLVHVHGMLGNTEWALKCSGQALPIFVRLGKRIHVGKVQWGIGSLLRAKGQYDAAVEAFGSARDEFAELGMVADVAATRLMIADLQLELGNDTEALREVLFALPIIEEYKLVPEGVAALSLLRESIQQQRLSHQALRDLHGFFEERVH
jgi:tetratricopeptide (TPR) repeat protein